MRNDNDLRYPLAWPQGWPRTPRAQISDSPFRKAGRKKYSMAEAVDELWRQLHLLRAQPPKGERDFIISTNVAVKLDGTPYSNRKQPEDQGAAVYFTLKKNSQVFACDKWDRIEDNVRAIAKHIEALRGQERWGVGSIERAFTGYLALEAPGASGKTWYAVLELSPDAGEDAVKSARRRLAKLYHPDGATPDPVKYQEVEDAYRDGMRQLGKLA